MSGTRGDWTHHALYSGLIFTATFHGVRRIPVRLSHAIGRCGTWLAWKLMGRTTEAVVDNLRAVRPDLDRKGLERLALLTYRSYARDTIDFIQALGTPAESLRRRFSGLDPVALDRVLAPGKGAIVATAHFGNWELGGLALSRLYGFAPTVVAMAEPSETINRIRRSLRADMGIRTLEVRHDLFTALEIRRLLGENRVVALLLDRHVGRDRIAVRFLDRQAFFLRTPALLACLSGAPLLPCFILRQPDESFRVMIADPIWVDADADRSVAIREATQSFASVLEGQVRRFPHLWYQFYSYWRAQEVAEDEPAVPAGASAPGGGVRDRT